MTPEFVSTDDEVVVEGADNGDQDKTIEEARPFVGAFLGSELFLSNLGGLATLLPIRLLSECFLNVMINMVSIVLVSLLLSERVFFLCSVVSDLLQSLDLFFGHVAQVFFKIFHKDIIITDEVFLLVPGHVLGLLFP